MKSFKKLMESIVPVSGDEENFIDKHVIHRWDEPNAFEHQFTGSTEKFYNAPDYKDVEDEAVYEEADPVDEMGRRRETEIKKKIIENNAFVTAAVTAKTRSKDKFNFGAKKYPVTVGKEIVKSMSENETGEDLEPSHKKYKEKNASSKFNEPLNELDAYKLQKFYDRFRKTPKNEESELDEGEEAPWMTSAEAARMQNYHQNAADKHKANRNMKGYAAHINHAAALEDAMVKSGGYKRIPSSRLVAKSDKISRDYPTPKKVQENEQLDELSKDTLSSYTDRVQKKMDKLGKSISTANSREYRAEMAGKKKTALNIYLKKKDDSSKLDKKYDSVHRANDIIYPDDNQSKTRTARNPKVAARVDAYRKSGALYESYSAGSLKLNDGTSVRVSSQDANLLNSMFKDLNPKNKDKMSKVLMLDKSGFEEILGFAREAN